MKTIPIRVALGVTFAASIGVHSQTASDTREGQLARVIASLTPAASGLVATAAPPPPDDGINLSLSPSGHVTYLGAPMGRAFAAGTARAGEPGLTARNFLKQNATMLGAPSAAVDFTTMRARAKRGRQFLRLQQTYGGVPVLAGEVIVQLNGQGDVDAVFSDIATANLGVLEQGRLPLQPRLTAADAAAVARAHYASAAAPLPVTTTEPELTIFAPEVLDEPGEARLVWDLQASCDDAERVAHRVLVDALSGGIVRAWQLGCHALNRRVYDGNNTTNAPPVLRRDEGDPPSTLAVANRAYVHLSEVYNFYSVNHGRDSYDGAGARIEATVRWCSASCGCPCVNAFSGNAANPASGMVFGNGYVADDLMGHEFTHRVTQLESGLIYTNASGAINESFSDCWGEFVDLSYNSQGDDTSAVRWLVGEDRTGGAGGRLRSMVNPPDAGDPDRLNSQLYQPSSNTADNGGVHVNSGVNNKLCYLLVDGATFNGQTVSGLGLARVADLYYEVQTDLLTSGANYFSLGNALRQAAVNLGWSSADQNNVYRACLAVEIIAGSASFYVDKTSGCLFLTGNQNCGVVTGPWKTLAQGVSGISAGNTLRIHGANYNELITIRKAMTLRNYTGTVNLGQP